MTDATPQARPVDRSLEHVLARLELLEARVRSAVARRRSIDPEPEDRFRGLYLSDAAIDRLLVADHEPLREARAEELTQAVEAGVDDSEGTGVVVRLRTLARSFHLDFIDTELLLVALAPDVDQRFEGLYGYLQDDVTRRRASVGLALELSGLRTTSADDRARLSPAGRLTGAGLLVIEDLDRPTLTRSLRVPDRVTSHLLGGDTIDPELAAIADWSTRPSAGRGSAALELALRDGISPVYVREIGVASGTAMAATSAAAVGADALVIDLARLVAGERPLEVVRAAIREAGLRRVALVAGPVEALIDGSKVIIAALAEASWPVVIVGERSWDPGWSRAIPLLLEARAAGGPERTAMWQDALHAGDGAIATNGHADVLIAATRAFHLTPLQVERAAAAARLRARAEERPLEPADLQAGARAQNAAGLDRLAHRIEPRAGWPDLVLPAAVQVQLSELAARARHRERVLDEWGIGGRSTRGRGITALFSGESGTGKTLGAEVIAGELGLDLYVIDLSTVVDKYIGETEKNLDRIFAEADRVNAVLLFDEADAIFGKRSEVRDARDRYANVEVAYLLQRMERFDGLAVLTTNLRANLDDAFTRRIDVMVDFPMPEEEGRLALWRMHLPDQLPQADDLDLAFTARRFRLSGGNIRNICLTAAFLAADAERPVAMAHLILATEREYRKLGRLTVEAEFGPYHALIAAAAGVGDGRGPG